MELWDIYDKDRQKTGLSQERNNPMKEGNYHLVVHVWIINEKGEFLIQKRQPWKKGWPNMWDCSAAGCAIMGETTKDAVVRETKEELGIDLDINKAEILFSVKFSSGFDDIWFVKQNIDIEQLELQYEEVADAKWSTYKEIKKMIQKGEFINYHYLDNLFVMISTNLIHNDSSLNNMKLKKPASLKLGDKVATISLSWGGAGDKDIRWRYEVGKKRLQEDFGLKVVEMPHTLSGTEYLYNHPEKRAEDLMRAFSDPTIKAIFSCIGGDESIRMLPYIDYEVIKNNPKIFIGYSDTTVTHFICLKAGLSSFYGPSILAEFAENVEMFEYTKHWIKKALFENAPIGTINSSEIWTSEHLPWREKNKSTKRAVKINTGYELLQGSGKAQGHLLGGCLEVLEMIKGTELWPKIEDFEDCILFFETSEDKSEPKYVELWLRSYGTLGILQKAKGIIFGKPYDNVYYEEYKKVILKVVREELKLVDLPILYNMNFGHTAPMFIIPYGALAEIDCDLKMVTVT